MEAISKIAKLFGYASIAFAVILAIITVLLIQLIQSANGSQAPLDYIIYTTLQNIWPYLFIATLSLLVGYKLPTEETEEAEEMPPEQTQLP
jgi:hypothetical protein